MTDIVERLRGHLTPHLTEADETLHNEAADEIERLRENEHLANGVADLAMKHRDVAEAEVERLRERNEILEAEIRVMRQLPGAISDAMDKLLDKQ